uniref:Uncharacterized protein n=1 Tax=Dicentrarchus labrax TaxID=13489 RepID=A0A8C4DKS8_DICLA
RTVSDWLQRFSMSTRSLTPSTTIWTSSTSEKPRRSALEMSKTPPTAAVSTPPGSEGQGSTLVSPVQKRVKTSLMLPPFCMLMTRRWSSSFTHTRNVLLSLCLQARVDG